MADKPIGQLPAAPSNLQLYSGAELLVLEQDGTAKKLSMQILENWLLSFAAGHGGIRTISKTGTSGFVDTYTITFADQSTATFTVTNGNGITGVTQYWAVSSSNTTVPSSWSTTRQTMTPTQKYLWSYMTFQRDRGSFSTTKSVVGVYGDTGQAWYVWIKYAGVQPTSDADMGDTPDNWIGIYSGTASTAPTHYTNYQWFEIKGEKGDTGDTGASIASITRTGGTGEAGSTDTYTITLDTGTVAGTFTVYNGLNGTGAVASVNGVNPDASGNVTLAAANINTSGGTTVQAALTDISENKQNRITANGILKGNGSGNISAVGSIKTADLADGSVTAPKIADGAVTQEKLSVNARCGLVIGTPAGKNLENSDAGNTYYAAWTSTGSVKTWTLNAELSAAIPNGFAVAFTELWPNDKIRISISGVRLLHRGEGQLLVKSQSAVLGLVERCNMIALQKMNTDATNGDVWLITGDVEVIS